jgi:hypothetical protein
MKAAEGEATMKLPRRTFLHLAAGAASVAPAEPRFGQTIRLCSYVANPLSRSRN